MTNRTDISTAAAALGSKGGKSTSKAKTNASRANGAKGGRLPKLGVELDEDSFAVVRFSWSGFRNEGGYYYGTQAELEKLHEAYNPAKSLYKWIGDFATLDQAQSVAERLAYRDNRQAHHSEQVNICAEGIWVLDA